ncbi:MAG: carboxypeptidase-like regulatory domain-containing protein, partial [Flavobacteriaceae bacterium]|nr:carboxypeptidase-like regulatory domain-containing protein [Flavobacteriaceae bacterium]
MLFKNSILILFIALSSILVAQKTVTGNVSSADGPLPGATVAVKASATGTTTDFDGNFSIAVADQDVLVVSYVGFATQEVLVADATDFNIVMQADQLLDEVVITALGISREKKSLGYAVTEVAGDNVNTIKDNNLANSLS